jgi:lipoyl(octanoyl) transferase
MKSQMHADEREIMGGRDDVGAECLAPPLCVRDLGRMPYAEAFVLQKELQQEVIAQRCGEDEPAVNSTERLLGYLLLVEHDPPVITVSRRKTARQHLIATPEQLELACVKVAETDRGGDITYHGPGQLVVYPIVDLNLLGLRLHGYMRLLEQVVIETLAHFRIKGEQDEAATGVWVRPASLTDEFEQYGTDGENDAPPIAAKICAMGVRVSRWVTMHGLALNVTTNLQHFQLIVPCGLAGRQVTSMSQLLGERCPSLDEVKRVFTERFRRAAEARIAARP